MKIFTLAAAAAIAATALAQTPKMGFVTYEGMADDDELAAKAWFQTLDNTALVNASDLATIDAAEYPVLWVMVDRVGQGTAMPSDISADALKTYLANGGKLYLSNMATQLCPAIGLTPDFAPGVFDDGEGGTGDDIWTLNAELGFDFRPEGNRPGLEGYYNKKDHPIYAGLEFDNHNGWDQATFALIGPGHRENHNSLWDANILGKGDQLDVVTNFDKTFNAETLATWGHVQDHCVVGIADFNNGQAIANGLAAYEWNQNSGKNEYQANVEALTSNILNYLAKDVTFEDPSAVAAIEAAQGEAAYYTLQGVRVAAPETGVYIVVKDGKAVKALF